MISLLWRISSSTQKTRKYNKCKVRSRNQKSSPLLATKNQNLYKEKLISWKRFIT